MSGAPRFRAHIGAHKTATTHLQALLEHLAPELNGAEIKLLSMDVTRPACRIAARRGRKGLVQGWRDSIQLDITHVPKVQRAAMGTQLAVLSDEDILGWTQDQLEAEFYPNLAGLDLLRKLGKGRSMQVYLSVRGYETQMSSAFFEALKVFSDTPERLAKGIEAVTTGRSSWLILMERIAQALPQAELLFWRQEDYARDAQPIVERFLGRSLPPLPDLPRPQSTASPNANALAEVAGLDPSLPKMQRHGLVEEIYARHPRGQGPEPDLLSAEQREALRAAYARDIDAMRARFTDIGQADADQKAASGPAAEGGAQ